MEKNSKIEFWQYVRGVCIILVVLIHSRSGRLYLGDTASLNFDYWLTLRSVINVPVSIFIFLAGYFTSVHKLKSQTLIYIKNRIVRLVIPFLLWSTVYHLIEYGIDGSGLTIDERVTDIALGSSSSQLYFVLVLMQLTVLSPLMLKAADHKIANGVFLSLTPLYLIALYRFVLVNGTQFDFYETWFPAWMIFYYAGLYVRAKGLTKLITNNLKTAVVLVILAVGLSILENYSVYLSGMAIRFASSQIKFSGFILSFAVLNLLFVLRNSEIESNAFLKFLAYLGDHSFGIYFSHMICVSVVEDVLTAVPYITDILPLYHSVHVLLTLALSIVFYELIKLGLNKNNARKYLGI